MSATLPLPLPAAAAPAQPSRSYWTVVWRQLRRDPRCPACGDGELVEPAGDGVFALPTTPAATMGVNA